MGERGRNYRRYIIASLATFSLIFQAIVAAAMLPMSLGIQAAQAAGASSNAIIICTPSGMKQITFDENGDPVEKTLPGQHCPVCDALAINSFALPGTLANAPGPLVDAGFIQPRNEILPIKTTCHTLNNRGPPSHI